MTTGLEFVGPSSDFKTRSLRLVEFSLVVFYDFNPNKLFTRSGGRLGRHFECPLFGTELEVRRSIEKPRVKKKNFYVCFVCLLFLFDLTYVPLLLKEVLLIIGVSLLFSRYFFLSFFGCVSCRCRSSRELLIFVLVCLLFNLSLRPFSSTTLHRVFDLLFLFLDILLSLFLSYSGPPDCNLLSSSESFSLFSLAPFG